MGRERLTAGERTLRALRSLYARPQLKPELKQTEVKLKAIRGAASHSFPTAEIVQMLSEIERGYER
jgi:hypothetical protein